MANWLARLIMRFDRQSRVPRLWSNDVLKRIGHHFTGDIVNVSAWKDEDKAGGHYADYFPNAASYAITNHQSDRGVQDNELVLNLEEPLPTDLAGRFTVVFNHTTLEHIYDVHTAVRNLCEMTTDAVIVVVPFLQVMHYTETFGDYWRFTPMSLRRLFADNGLSVVYEAYTDHRMAAVYLLVVASKQPEKWQSVFNHAPVDGNMKIGGRAITAPLTWLYRLAYRLKLIP